MPDPTIEDLITAGKLAVVGQADKTADFVRGSDYETLTGPNAILWSRQLRRDKDLFDAIKFHTARGEDLTNLVKERYGIDRILDTHGAGVATLTRPAGGIADKAWVGTRISVGSKKYRVTVDTPIASAATTQIVPIEAVEVGPGSAVSTSINTKLDDTLTDPTWGVSSVTCADGTLFESATTFIARVRALRTAARVGHAAEIEAACKAAGAGQVALFRSDYGGDATDAGLNVCFVGDAGYYGTPALVKACTLALRKARVLGDHMQVLPMARASLSVVVDVYLRDSPAVFNIPRLEQTHTQAIVQHLGGSSGGYTFTRTGIASAVRRPTPEVQKVVIISPAADVAVRTAGNFPAVLNRYVVNTIALRYRGP